MVLKPDPVQEQFVTGPKMDRMVNLEKTHSARALLMAPASGLRECGLPGPLEGPPPAPSFAPTLPLGRAGDPLLPS